MLRMTLILFAMVGTVLMGMGVTAVLAMNLPGWQPVALAAAAGFLVAVPVSWFVARQILGNSA